MVKISSEDQPILYRISATNVVFTEPLNVVSMDLISHHKYLFVLYVQVQVVPRLRELLPHGQREPGGGIHAT